MPNNLKEALEMFKGAVEELVEALHDHAEAAPAGAGEVAEADHGRINDDTEITMRSGDLREVIDAYRKLVRFARTGKIPTQKERMEGHAAVKAVKHLIRKPVRNR